ncbi:hypothetical protein AUW26_14150 [Streptomyces sp. CC71]|nr:hypothetical protein AUW26_14150 [Streptomyces sp. CC71]
MASQVSTPGSEVLPFSCRASRASVWRSSSRRAARESESAERSTPAPWVMIRWMAVRDSGGRRGWTGSSRRGRGAGTRGRRVPSARAAAMWAAMRSA